MKFLICLLITMMVLPAHSQEEKTSRPIYPHHIKGQFAGGIGFVSVGAGYRMARDKIETDLFFGIVPKRYAGENLEIITAKFTWLAAKRFNISEKVVAYPFFTGLQVNYTNGENLILDLSTKYPKGYYGWTTAVHAGIFVGAKAGLLSNNSGSEKVLGYVEIGTNEIEAISYAINRQALKPWDIINIGLGVQFILR